MWFFESTVRAYASIIAFLPHLGRVFRDLLAVNYIRALTQRTTLNLFLLFRIIKKASA
jgi:hypothetical protein